MNEVNGSRAGAAKKNKKVALREMILG